MTHMTRLNNMPNYLTGGYAAAHRRALQYPHGMEIPMVSLLKGWLSYADALERQLETPIGEDNFLGPRWAQIGKSIASLLNGEVGRLDSGTICSIISDTLSAEGYNIEDIAECQTEDD